MRVILGMFTFFADTGICDEIRRSSSHRFAVKERLHQRPVRHSKGPGDDTFNLPGNFYPCVKGEPDSLDELRDLMDSGNPQYLIDINGVILGLFYITDVNESQREFIADKPREISFDVSLVRAG